MSNEHLLNTLKNSPWLQEEAQRELNVRLDRRREYLRQIEASNETFRKTDAALISKADPIERRLNALRAEVTDLEAKFRPLVIQRSSAMSINAEEVRQLRVKLREETSEGRQLLRVIDQTRDEVSTNIGGRRAAILGENVTTARISEVLALLLRAYRETERLIVEEADIVEALDQMRSDLAAEGVRLIDVP